MRYLLTLTIIALISSCSDSFINHELKFEKLGDCSGVSKPVNMISNINGEHYEFECCMDGDFDGKNYTVVRKGDSLVVNFPKTSGKNKALYSLVLDIDAKPNYHHIILDDKDITVVPAER